MSSLPIPNHDLETLSESPLTQSDLATLPRLPRVKSLRRALGMTQDAFAATYRIPLGTLRDWEQGRSTPDQTALAYLKVIAHAPEVAAAAFQRREADEATA